MCKILSHTLTYARKSRATASDRTPYSSRFYNLFFVGRRLSFGSVNRRRRERKKQKQNNRIYINYTFFSILVLVLSSGCSSQKRENERNSFNECLTWTLGGQCVRLCIRNRFIFVAVFIYEYFCIFRYELRIHSQNTQHTKIEKKKTDRKEIIGKKKTII